MAGTSVDAIDRPAPGPILVADAPENADGAIWRLEPDGPSGRLSAAAVGILDDAHRPGRFTDDLNGDGSPEVSTRDLDRDVVLFDVGQLGAIGVRDAWLASEDRLLVQQWDTLVDGTPDLNADGQGDLTLLFEDAIDTWYGPLDPATFAIDRPDAHTPAPPHDVDHVFGLRSAEGVDVFLVSWRASDDEPGHLVRLRPGQGLADAEGVDTGEGSGLVASGALDGHPGEDALIRGRPESRLFTVDEAGLPFATGFALEASPDAGAAGDFDGDGVDDLAVIGFEAVYVFRGPLAPGTVTYDDADLRVSSGVADDGFGADLAAADVDGDGRDDLVVGAPQDDGLAPDGGAVYLWRGVDLFP